MLFHAECAFNRDHDVYITSPMWDQASQLAIRYLSITEEGNIVYRLPPDLDIMLQVDGKSWQDPSCDLRATFFSITPTDTFTFVILNVHCVLVAGSRAKIEFWWLTN